MTHLDTARGSFHLLRQKPWSNSWPKVQKSGHVLIGKWAWESGAILFLKDKKAPDDRSFFPHCGGCQTPGKKNRRESCSRGEEKIYLKNFQFSQKWLCIVRPLTPTFGLGQTSIASPSLFRCVGGEWGRYQKHVSPSINQIGRPLTRWPLSPFKWPLRWYDRICIPIRLRRRDRNAN